jgi:hypothetical protein
MERMMRTRNLFQMVSKKNVLTLIVFFISIQVFAQKIDFPYAYAFISEKKTILVKLKEDTIIHGIPCHAGSDFWFKDKTNCLLKRKTNDPKSAESIVYQAVENKWRVIVASTEQYMPGNKLLSDEDEEFSRMMFEDVIDQRDIDLEIDMEGNIIYCFISKKTFINGLEYQKRDVYKSRK